MRKAIFALGVLMMLLCFGAKTATAQLTWVPTTGGLFNTPGNWMPLGPPVAGQVAQYTTTTTQTIIYETNVGLGTQRIENGNVTFQLNQTTNTMSGGSGLIVGNTAGLTGRLTILNGKMTGDMAIGNVDASTGFFTIGADAIFDALINATSVGENGIGTLTIIDGGHFTASSVLSVGSQVGSNGAVFVSGLHSSLSTNVSNIFIGASGLGAMTISDGATASGAILSVGDASAGSGSLTISGAGSTVT